jgi:hypothetical protein
MRLLASVSTALAAGCAATVLGSAPREPDVGGAGPPPPLRELNTDRPDVTESPFTVDAGHLQLELDLVNYTRDAGEDRRVAWGVAPLNLRLGVRENLELGLFVAPFRRDTVQPTGGTSETHTGFGDVTLRAKVNFWGNDGGGTALGLIADLKLPTATAGLGNGAVEGTMLVPVSLELGGGWDLGAMTGAGFRRSDSGGGSGTWINSVTVGHGLTRDLAGYCEVATETAAGAPVTTFDVGLTLRLNANAQLDVGAQFGLSHAADDTLVFTGLTRRY